MAYHMCKNIAEHKLEPSSTAVIPVWACHKLFGPDLPLMATDRWITIFGHL